MDWLTSVFDGLNDFSSSPWFYLLIIGVIVMDAVFPVAPSESLVIVGGVSAGLGNLNIFLVILASIAGAIIGDNLGYLIGARASGFVYRITDGRPKLSSRLLWAEKQIHKRGGSLLVVARFIPGGRTALTMSYGLTKQKHRVFLGWDAVAALLWAVYTAMLGYAGGRTFQDNNTAAFLAAFAGAVVFTGLIELFRRKLEKRAESRADEL